MRATSTLPFPLSRMSLPEPNADARAHSERLAARVRDEIAARGGWMSFARYMELALYEPGLGYYSAGARKLGRDGDFTTAPELTPLFGQAIAHAAAEVLGAGYDAILEVGAGSGALAASVLEELERLGRVPRDYLILELSADLRERSRDMLAARVPHLLDRVAWLNRLPPSFEGLVLGNEVLDAMPVELIRVTDDGVEQAGVVAGEGGFAWDWRRAPEGLVAEVARLSLPSGYVTEVGVLARAFLHSLGAVLARGVAIFIDYGFPAREYYHPQRAQGTLMCHYRHRAHGDPFFLPGLQDITAHVDFTAVARAASDAGMEILGYTSQAQFLIGCGLTELMLRVPPEDAARYLPQAAAAQKLVSPAEMGELFKAIALGKNYHGPLTAFASGDRTDSL
ncbi:MAG: SAM-dependent methyltransferase [Burkholderiales bacterium]|nr:SAM-dependent methyltransferase [Burkholderiales bacterium]